MSTVDRIVHSPGYWPLIIGLALLSCFAVERSCAPARAQAHSIPPVQSRAVALSQRTP